MNKTEFLRVLEEGLQKASPEERVAALQYYTEYLDEAGPENEAAAIEELGTPEKVAADILAASGAQNTENWTPPTPPPQSPLEPDGVQQPTAPPPPQGWAQGAGLPTFSFLNGKKNDAPTGGDGNTQSTAGYDTNNTRIFKIILVILACIFLVPIIGGLGGGLVGIIVAIFFVFFVPIIAGIAFVGSGIACIVGGALVTAASIPSALVIIGVGVCLVGLGLLCCYAGGRLLGRTLPNLVRKLIDGFRWLVRKVFPGKSGN